MEAWQKDEDANSPMILAIQTANIWLMDVLVYAKMELFGIKGLSCLVALWATFVLDKNKKETVDFAQEMNVMEIMIEKVLTENVDLSVRGVFENKLLINKQLLAKGWAQFEVEKEREEVTEGRDVSGVRLLLFIIYLACTNVQDVNGINTQIRSAFSYLWQKR